MVRGAASGFHTLQIFIKEDTHYVELEEMYSMSYPGLLTRYTLHRVQGVIPELPQVGV